MTTAGNACSTR